MRYPDHSISVDNYSEIRDDLTAFADRRINFLLVIGRTGIGKSRAAEEIISPYVIFGGKPSAWGFYCGLYESRNANVVLDDVSPRFFGDPTCQSLLKALTDTAVKLKKPSPSRQKRQALLQILGRPVLLLDKWNRQEQARRRWPSRPIDSRGDFRDGYPIYTRNASAMASHSPSTQSSKVRRHFLCRSRLVTRPGNYWPRSTTPRS